MKAALAHRALAWLYAALLVALCAYAYFGKQALPLLGIYAPAVLLVVLCVMHMVLARASRVRRPWARLASILIGFLLLPAFPLGTLAGVYLIAASWNPWPEAHTHAGAPRGAWPSDAVRDRPRTTGRV